MSSSRTLQPTRREAAQCVFQIQTRQFPFLDEASMGAGDDGCKGGHRTPAGTHHVTDNNPNIPPGGIERQRRENTASWGPPTKRPLVSRNPRVSRHRGFGTPSWRKSRPPQKETLYGQFPARTSSESVGAPLPARILAKGSFSDRPRAPSAPLSGRNEFRSEPIFDWTVPRCQELATRILRQSTA